MQEKIERVKREFEESRHGHFGSRWINFKNLRVKIEREPSEVKLRAERERSEVPSAMAMKSLCGVSVVACMCFHSGQDLRL